MVASTRRVTLGGKSFAKQIQDLADEVQLRADLVYRKIALDVYAGLLARTRVDTGRLRGSWRVSLNAVDSSIEAEGDAGKAEGASEGDPPTGAETAYQDSILSEGAFGDSFHFTNSLPYAEVWDDRDNIIDDTLADLEIRLDGIVTDVRKSREKA